VSGNTAAARLFCRHHPQQKTRPSFLDLRVGRYIRSQFLIYRSGVFQILSAARFSTILYDYENKTFVVCGG
jgi:hypothetical protein